MYQKSRRGKFGGADFHNRAGGGGLLTKSSTPNDSRDEQLEQESQAAQNILDGSHDNLGVSGDQANDEIQALNDLYNEPSFSRGSNTDEDDMGATSSDDEVAPETPEAQEVQDKTGSSLFDSQPAMSIPKRGNRGKIGFGAGSAAVALLFLIVTLLPMPLVQLYKLLDKFHAAPGKTALDRRLTRVRQRLMWSRNDNEIVGHKNRTFLSVLSKNYEPKDAQFLRLLETRGYKVDPIYDKNGKWNGGIASIFKDGQAVFNSGDSSFWSRRSELRTLLREMKAIDSSISSGFWTRHKLYKLYGVDLGNWWKENAVSKEVTTKIGRWRAITRARMKKMIKLGSIAKAKQQAADKDGDGVVSEAEAQQAAASDSAANQTSADAAEDAKRFTDVPDADLDLQDPLKGLDIDASTDLNLSAGKIASGAAGKAARGLSVLGIAQTACSVVQTARYYKVTVMVAVLGAYLAYNKGVVGSLISSIPSGENGNTGSLLMSVLNTKDEKGDTGFNTAEYSMVAGNTNPGTPKYQSDYTSDGSLAGKLAGVITTVVGILGGAAAVGSVCKGVTNPLVQIGGLAAGVLLAIGSFGTGTAVNIAAQTALGIATGVAVSYMVQRSIKAAAGQAVDNFAVGGKAMGLIVGSSGAASMMTMMTNGAKPLTRPQARVARQNVIDEQKDINASKPFLARLFDASEPTSILGATIAKNPVHTGKLKEVAFGNLKPHRIASMLNLNSNSLALSDEIADLCPNEDYKKNNIAVDSFCFPIMGETDALDQIDPIENIKWLTDNGHIDENNNPLSEEYKDYNKQCFDNQYVHPLVYVNDKNEYELPTFTNKCMTDGATTAILPEYDWMTKVTYQKDTRRLAWYESIFSDETYAQETTTLASPTVGLSARFRAHRIDVGSAECVIREAEFGHCDAGQQNGAQSSSGPTSYSSTIPGLGTDSSGVSCAAGTIDLGVHSAYSAGTEIKARLCGISELPSGGSESTPGSSYFVSNPDDPSKNAEGKAIVDARISANVLAMAKDARGAGVQLSAVSTFRTHSHQIYLCGGTCDGTYVARPGYSNHQTGHAIDFNLPDPYWTKGDSSSCSGRAEGRGYPMWDWLYANAHKYGYKQYSGESWHWDAMDANNRCGPS